MLILINQQLFIAIILIHRLSFKACIIYGCKTGLYQIGYKINKIKICRGVMLHHMVDVTNPSCQIASHSLIYQWIGRVQFVTHLSQLV